MCIYKEGKNRFLLTILWKNVPKFSSHHKVLHALHYYVELKRIDIILKFNSPYNDICYKLLSTRYTSAVPRNNY